MFSGYVPSLRRHLTSIPLKKNIRSAQPIVSVGLGMGPLGYTPHLSFGFSLATVRAQSCFCVSLLLVLATRLVCHFGSFRWESRDDGFFASATIGVVRLIKCACHVASSDLASSSFL